MLILSAFANLFHFPLTLSDSCWFIEREFCFQEEKLHSGSPNDELLSEFYTGRNSLPLWVKFASFSNWSCLNNFSSIFLVSCQFVVYKCVHEVASCFSSEKIMLQLPGRFFYHTISCLSLPLGSAQNCNFSFNLVYSLSSKKLRAGVFYRERPVLTLALLI